MSFEHHRPGPEQEDFAQEQHKDALFSSFDNNEHAQQLLSTVDKNINTTEELPQHNETIAQQCGLLNELLEDIKQWKSPDIREKIEKSQEHYNDSTSRAYVAMNHNNVSQVLGTGDWSKLFTYDVTPPQYAESIKTYYNNPPEQEIYPPVIA